MVLRFRTAASAVTQNLGHGSSISLLLDPDAFTHYVAPLAYIFGGEGYYPVQFQI
jgi:hypothetical protein